MNEKLHDYNFGELEIKLPRHWVPISELDQIAEEFSQESGTQNNYDTLKILKEKNIDVKNDKADFNGVNFFLLHLGLINGEFLSRIMKYNFKDSYTNIDHLCSYIEILKKQYSMSLDEDEEIVVSALRELVSN